MRTSAPLRQSSPTCLVGSTLAFGGA